MLNKENGVEEALEGVNHRNNKKKIEKNKIK